VDVRYARASAASQEASSLYWGEVLLGDTVVHCEVVRSRRDVALIVMGQPLALPQTDQLKACLPDDLFDDYKCPECHGRSRDPAQSIARSTRSGLGANAPHSHHNLAPIQHTSTTTAPLASIEAPAHSTPTPPIQNQGGCALFPWGLFGS
jgi:hypothetical protein